MYLKRLEIEGFKSFADRTVVPFETGLTGIVGPNGCGKSNVVDALLWVMAERSPKALRADSMEDVIFEGAEGRPAASYAMVEIILVDEENLLEAGGEVAVGRRLFRTGESEYLLNGRKVKRKEVREVLLAAGLGVRGYMVLAQGKIDAVLAANPKDRRSVLEEAAGISRYKARKHETLLKLNQVALNLERIDDVLGEVQRAVRSLRIQAGKAQRFAEMRDRYRELRVKVALADETKHRVDELALREREGEVEASLEALRNARSEAEERLRTLEKEEEALRAQYDELRQRAGGAKERAAGLEERVRGLEARAAELEQRVQRERERLTELTDQGREQAENAATIDKDLAEAQVEAVAASEAWSEASVAHEATRDALRVHREQVEELRKGVLEALTERTRLHNALGEIAHRRSEAEGALRALERRQGEAGSERERLATEAATAAVNLKAAREQVEAHEGAHHDLVATRDDRRAKLDQHRRSAQEAHARGAEAKARLEALSTIDETGQGLPRAVRQLVVSKPAGVRGLLLEGVRVSAPWDRLVENLLGRMQHGLWADNRDSVGNLGSGEFDVFFAPPKPPQSVNVPPCPTLRSLLEGDDDRCDAVCARLGEVYCADTAAEAARFAKEYPGALFLSRDGELHSQSFARVGMLTGDAAGLLARRNACEDARNLIRAAQTEETRSRESEATLVAEVESLEKRLESAASDLRTALSERDRAQARADEIDRRRSAIEEEWAALEAEEAVGRKIFDEARTEEAESTVARDEAEQRRAKLAAELEAAETSAGERAETSEAAAQALQDAEIRRDRSSQALAHLESRKSENTARAARAADERQKLEGEVGGISERMEGLRAEAEEGKAEIRTLLTERGGLEERVREAATQCERASEALLSEREKRDDGGGKLEGILEERQTLALDLQRIHLQREELSRGLREEFQQTLPDLARGMGVDPSTFAMEAEEHEASATELGGLRAKLESIGAVNLEAVRDLEEREERLTFLDRERSDLFEARRHLEATLEELDTLCRDRFIETFESVRDQFETIFRRLFRGGKAEVILTPDMDPLEAGIEVSVRPPGKELRSINLLSGGERTLTALALLLAVFRSRPSPFCLLDEVDAALDDANVERFLDVLRDFTKDTQFVVVTHNRLTMGSCQRLFGVTMRRRGVSQLVAVDIAEVVAQGLAEPAKAPVAAGNDRLKDVLPAEQEMAADG